ncbi:hypothetical protein F511_19722 [Dorcoceras hygrometricum]|uniref:Uncharacterized protein n=1 Tax=Dorcoceras hygrometricum TaxID=472368 RepID=A0A2Z7CVR6_9LAMI|nr:hypothetical protein F511_19722 [Dorcoceras hygrometricum]
MSLFDLQDVCRVIGSLATLDLTMVVDLIGIYVLKGPYCTLTMTNWFLQALSVIPRGSWGDVARRFTMIRWGYNITQLSYPRPSTSRPLSTSTSRPPLSALRHLAPPPAAVRFLRGWTCFDHVDEELPDRTQWKIEWLIAAPAREPPARRNCKWTNHPPTSIQFTATEGYESDSPHPLAALNRDYATQHSITREGSNRVTYHGYQRNHWLNMLCRCSNMLNMMHVRVMPENTTKAFE